MIGGGVSAGLRQQLMRSRWRRFTLRLSSLVEVGLAGLRTAFLPAVALLVLVLMVPALWRELQKAEPQAALVTALVSLILVAAVAAQLGGALLGRLKKLGPLELFGKEVSSLLATLDRIDPHLRLSSGTNRLGPDELFSYQELDRYVSQVEFSNLTLEGRHRERFFRLLHTVSATAIRQEDWWKARGRSELLARLSEGRYRPAKVFFDLGLTLLQCGESLLREPHTSKDALKKAQDSFTEAARHLTFVCEATPQDHAPWFFLGFVLARLRLYPQAIEANDRALELYPTLAQAKYNRAVCHSQAGDMALAYGALCRIEATDDGARQVGEKGLTDPDLAEVREHGKFGAPTRRILQRLADR